jgi:hypothetical protein
VDLRVYHGKDARVIEVILRDAAEIVTRKSAGTPVAIVRGAADWIGEVHGPRAPPRRQPRPVPLTDDRP